MKTPPLAYDLAGAAASRQAHSAKLDAIATLVSAAGWLYNDGAGNFSYSAPSAAPHQLDGAQHTVGGLTPGHFLKATGAATFGFVAHGLTYSDVGAAASGHNHAGVYDPAGAAAAVTPITLGLVIGTNVQAYNANLTGVNQALDTTAGPTFNHVHLTGLGSGYVPHHTAAGLADTGLYYSSGQYYFFSSTGGLDIYFNGDSINTHYPTNANAALYINYYGYNNGATQFRDLFICDGKGATLAFVDGSAASIAFGGITDFTYSEKFIVKGGAYNTTFANADYAGGAAGASLMMIFGAASGATYARLCALTGGGTAWGNLCLQDGGGSVGIGTTTPGDYNAIGNNLVVYEAGNGGITIATPGNSGYLNFADGTSGADSYRGIVAYLHAEDSMVFYTNASEKVRILTGGSVLIGATAAVASEKLRVNGAVYIDTSIQSPIFWVGPQVSTYGNKLYNAAANLMYCGIPGTAAGDLFYFITSAGSGAVYITATGNIYGEGNCSFLTFTDRTPYPKDTDSAWKAVKSMKRREGSDEIDHSLLDSSLLVVTTNIDPKTKTPMAPVFGRDLSMTVSSLVEALKDAELRIVNLEKKIKAA